VALHRSETAAVVKHARAYHGLVRRPLIVMHGSADVIEQARCSHCVDPLMQRKGLVAGMYQKRLLQSERFNTRL
jgi:hypothetical protein